jgi:hypothetical protein
VAEKKKSSKKAAEPVPAQPATPAAPVDPNAPKVLGPGVIKRPKRDPAAPEQVGGQELTYKPSDQVFRRRG